MQLSCLTALLNGEPGKLTLSEITPLRSAHSFRYADRQKSKVSNKTLNDSESWDKILWLMMLTDFFFLSFTVQGITVTHLIQAKCISIYIPYVRSWKICHRDWLIFFSSSFLNGMWGHRVWCDNQPNSIFEVC